MGNDEFRKEEFFNREDVKEIIADVEKKLEEKYIKELIALKMEKERD